MPQEWYASGVKLGLHVDVKFTYELCAYGMNKESLLGDKFPPFLSVKPLNTPTFISAENGLEEVMVTRGAYGCQLQVPETKQYAFRFFLDFPEGAIRNDVELPAERIYFMSSCWIEDKLTIEWARKWEEDMLESIERINKEINEMEQSHVGLFEKTMGFRKYFILLE